MSQMVPVKKNLDSSFVILSMQTISAAPWASQMLNIMLLVFVKNLGLLHYSFQLNFDKWIR